MRLYLDFNFPKNCNECRFREHYRIRKENKWRCRLFSGEISNNEYYTGKKISTNCLTDKEYDLMLHAIGYEKKKAKHIIYRNYFCTSISDSVWIGLEKKKLAEIVSLDEKKRTVTYSVTQKGIELLEKYTGSKMEV